MGNGTQSVQHPAGLWVLFTTEMWERFAFYTMRAILVLYLVDISTNVNTPGFGWSESDAYKLYGWYTGLVYIAPILGGWIADRFLGQRICVVIGAVLMALGEFCLAATEFVRIGNVDVTVATDLNALITFYAGLGLMVLGNGFFKPCISVMVGQLYAPGDRMRDSAFSIFYMGINIGAFLSPLIGGTVAEKYGYQYGFIIAGLGMIFGIISFTMFGQKHLKGLGAPPVKHGAHDEMTQEEREIHEKAVHEQQRPLVQKDWDRIFVILVLSIFVIAFWVTFEQAGSSLNIFAKANTNRTIAGSVLNVTPEKVSKTLFLENEDFDEFEKIVKKVKTLTEQIDRKSEKAEPAGLVDRFERFNLYAKMTKKTEAAQDIENQIAELKAIAADLIHRLRISKHEDIQGGIAMLDQAVKNDEDMIQRGLLMQLEFIATIAAQDSQAVEAVNTLKGSVEGITNPLLVAEKIREGLKNPILARILDSEAQEKAVEETKEKIAADIVIHESRRANILHAITTLLSSEQGKYGSEIQTGLLTLEGAERKFDARYVPGAKALTFPATWYQSVNACGIVIFAPIFTIIWGFLARRGIEPSTPTKFALGLILVSASFLVMIPGAIEAKATGGKAAAYWLILCYLFATWGELCLSPVGLSMITKLAPVRFTSLFMGVWFLASSIAYILAGYAASYFGTGEGVSLLFGREHGLADFFLLLAMIPMVIGFVALALAPTLKKMMHGVH